MDEERRESFRQGNSKRERKRREIKIYRGRMSLKRDIKGKQKDTERG